MTQQEKPNGVGFGRLCRAAACSWSGLLAALRYEAAFRQELLLVAVLAPLGLWLGESGVERALLVGSLLQILVVELVNSSIESVVDRIGLERHDLSGRAKDQGSTAVSMALVLAAVVWLLILFT